MSEALSGEDALDSADGRQGPDALVVEAFFDGLCPARQASVVEVEPFAHHELFDLGAGAWIHEVVLSGPGSPAHYPSRLLILRTISGETVRF
jgi:hypothetical protein